MGRVLVTRRLPDGGLDPLAGQGHEIVGPNADDTPYTHDELRAFARECDAIVSLLTDRIDADVLARGRRRRTAAGRRERRRRLRQHRRARRGDARHHRVQHAGRARRDDRRHRVPVDPRREPARVDRRGRPAHRARGRAGASRSTSAATCTARRSASSATVASGARSRARAEGFGMRVLHHARHPTNEPGYVADLDELLAECRHRVAAHARRRRHAPPDRRAPARADEADRGAREHRARHGRRRARAGRGAARGTRCSRPASTCTSASRSIEPRLSDARRAPCCCRTSVRRRRRPAPAWRRWRRRAVATVLAGGTPPNVVTRDDA